VAVPPPFRPGDPALCGSCPLVTPYSCRLGDLLCLFCLYPSLCLLLSVHVCILLFSLFDLSFVAFRSVLCYCWLGLLICKNRLPYNLYWVGGDVKHCSINQSINYVVYTVYCTGRASVSLCLAWVSVPARPAGPPTDHCFKVSVIWPVVIVNTVQHSSLCR